MRVCVLNITSGGMSGGYRTYLSNLVPRLATHPQVSALLIGLPRQVDLPLCRNGNGAVRWLSLRCSSIPMGPEVTSEEAKVIERFAPDVLFIPTSRFWSMDSVPVVNMVRNMMPTLAHNARYWLERMRNRARFRQMRSAVGKSDRVVAISQFVKNYLTGELGIPEDKVGVVYHGAQGQDNEPGMRPAAVPEASSGRFAFTAGLIYPYRGLEDQIEAWCRLRDLPNVPPLVIAGKVGQGMSRYYSKLQQLVRQRGLQSHIHFAGLLTAGEIVWCYRHCRCFIMSSRVEACPNIALEAMANGCICLSTANPPLPEIFGEAARYYPAGAFERLADSVKEVLAMSDEERGKMRTTAIARAASFTWDSCCDRTVAQLQKAI